MSDDNVVKNETDEVIIPKEPSDEVVGWSRKKKAIFLLSSVLLVSIAIIMLLLIVYFWRQSRVEDIAAEPQINNVQPTQIQPSDVMPTEGESADNSYTNERYGFSVKLPSDWTAEESTYPAGAGGEYSLSPVDNKPATFIRFGLPADLQVAHELPIQCGGANENTGCLPVTPAPFVTFEIALDMPKPSYEVVELNNIEWHKIYPFGNYDNTVWYYARPQADSQLVYRFGSAGEQEKDLVNIISSLKIREKDGYATASQPAVRIVVINEAGKESVLNGTYQRVVDGLKQYEPFATYRSFIEVKKISNDQAISFGCDDAASYKERSRKVICNWYDVRSLLGKYFGVTKADAIVLAFGEGNQSSADYEYDIIGTAAGIRPETIVHELAHIIADLQDEYLLDAVDLHAGRSEFDYKQINCFPALAKCQERIIPYQDDPNAKCVQGCSLPDWYRTTEDGLMRNTYNLNGYGFGPYDECVIAKKLEEKIKLVNPNFIPSSKFCAR